MDMPYGSVHASGQEYRALAKGSCLSVFMPKRYIRDASGILWKPMTVSQHYDCRSRLLITRAIDWAQMVPYMLTFFMILLLFLLSPNIIVQCYVTHSRSWDYCIFRHSEFGQTI